jgi:hypothetical protein
MAGAEFELRAGGLAAKFLALVTCRITGYVKRPDMTPTRAIVVGSMVVTTPVMLILLVSLLVVCPSLERCRVLRDMVSVLCVGVAILVAGCPAMEGMVCSWWGVS